MERKPDNRVKYVFAHFIWPDVANRESEIEQLLRKKGAIVVIVEVERGRESKGVIDIGLVENKSRFMKPVEYL